MWRKGGCGGRMDVEGGLWMWRKGGCGGRVVECGGRVDVEGGGGCGGRVDVEKSFDITVLSYLSPFAVFFSYVFDGRIFCLYMNALFYFFCLKNDSIISFWLWKGGWWMWREVDWWMWREGGCGEIF